jgi:hypothetical protein
VCVVVKDEHVLRTITDRRSGADVDRPRKPDVRRKRDHSHGWQGFSNQPDVVTARPIVDHQDGNRRIADREQASRGAAGEVGPIPVEYDRRRSARVRRLIPLDKR